MATSAEYQYIQPQNRTATGKFIDEHYSFDQIGFFVSACTQIDDELLTLLHTDTNNPIIFPLFDEKKTTHTNEALIYQLAHTVRHNPNMIAASIYYGSYQPLKQLQKDLPEKHHQLMPIVVTSTEGNQRKHSRILTPLGELLRTDRHVDLIDEVGDSMSTIATIVQARRAARLMAQYPATDGNLPYLLHDQFSKDSYGDAKPLYSQLIQHLIEENIALAIPVYKNKPFLEVLRVAADEQDSPWGERQRRYLQDILLVDKKTWALGKGMDALLKGSILSTKISHHLQEEHSLLDTLGEFNFRVGNSFQEIVGLHSLDALYDFSAAVLEHHTKAWLRN
jgi:hypoxanthine-guanine phosphoribosyltransferase